MISKSRTLDLVFVIILASLLLLGIGFQLGHSFTGTTNTFSVGALETSDVNFTGDWFRGTTNLTDRLLGSWGIAISATTLNTGQGANDLFDMDQNVQTGDSVTFGGITDSALTSGRVLFAGASGVLSDDAGMTYASGTDILTVGKLNTGQGDNELYDMDQNVETGSAVTFVTVDTGQGANELFDMDQNVLTSSTPVFSTVNATQFLWRNTDTLSNNATYGIHILGQAGEDLQFGDLVFLETDGDYMLGDANASATMYIVAMAAEDIANTAVGTFLITGYVRSDSWAAMTVGSANSVFAGWNGGDFSQTVPNTSGDQVQIVGYPISAQIWRFDPDSTVVEIT